MKVTKYRIIKRGLIYYPQVKRGCFWRDFSYNAFFLLEDVVDGYITYESALGDVMEHYTSTTGNTIVSTRECLADSRKIMIVSFEEIPNNYQSYIRVFGAWKNIDNNGRVVDEYVHKSREDACAAYEKYRDRHFDMRIEISGFNEIKNHPYVIEHGFPLTTK